MPMGDQNERNNMKAMVYYVAMGAGLLSLSGCEMTQADKGASLGAAAGAILGKATGNHKNKRVFIGGAIGAIAGAAVGEYMDRQEAALNDSLAGSGVTIVREGNAMRLVMPSKITFSSNQATISADFYSTLNDIADVMHQYDKTRLIITGHTDSEGTTAFNQHLSEQRAETIKNYLLAQEIAAGRLQAVGMGEFSSIASNTTAHGRALNRRVEIEIKAK